MKKRLITKTKIAVFLGAIAYAVLPGIFTVAAITKVVYDNKVELEKRIEKLELEIIKLKQEKK